jgi:uncharacterized GH25 family protein
MTKNEIITQLKKDFPTIREGSDEQGYVELLAEEYEARIAQWAENMLAKQAEAQAKLDAQNAKAALLERLGITADEAKLLLS